MGADGGVVYVSLRDPVTENWQRAYDLLAPFYQFMNRDGVSSVSQSANLDWEKKNPEVGFPTHLLGYWGTDRPEQSDLGNLYELCSFGIDEPVHQLTFNELDLDCRTRNDCEYYSHPVYTMFENHFKDLPRETVLAEFGPLLSEMLVKDWIKELNKLLHITSIGYVETWT